MRIYLVRHGDAVLEEDDPARPLSAIGRAEADAAAILLQGERAEIDEIWHSTRLRAKETAQIIAERLGVNNVLEKKGLSPYDPVFPIADQIKKSRKNILIASHMPFLGKLASLIKTGDAHKEKVEIKTGGVVSINLAI
ncbi:MAG: phosphohistidine phosphatase SixA [Candidatus Saganbacteria bacterium]|nr:phosphohistidine phosphatase SixA [Candidatus Saganbacteria bacterium]